MSMTPKQRVRAILERRPVDRIPVDLWYTGEVHDALVKHTGLTDSHDIWRKLGVDKIVWIGSPYNGAMRPVEKPGQTVTPWGCLLAPVQAGKAEYLEYADWPLGGMESPDELAAYPWWPDPDKFDYDAMVAELDRAGGEFATLGPWVSFFEIYCGMRGLENAMMDVLANPEFVQATLDRIERVQTAMIERFLERADGRLDMLFISDDMGSQENLLMSVDAWDELIGPRLKRWCDLAHRHGVKAFYHSDGAVEPLVERLIGAGIDVFNPIQHCCPGMDMAALKRNYGDRLVFHGAVDNQHVLPFGTADQVRAETADCLRSLASDGQGYICCSCHNMQAGTPVENILAMIETVHQAPALL